MRWTHILLLALLNITDQSGTNSSRPSQPKSKVSCVARNQQVVEVEHDKTVEKDDWIVDCTITVDEHVIWTKPLTLAHPATFRDAMDAIDEFRSKTAPRIVKEYRK